MQQNFIKGIDFLKKKHKGVEVIAVNGCCYGKDNKPQKKGYLKYCGQEFWEFITDDPNVYIKIIEPLGHKAKEKNEAFLKAYSKVINKFTLAFALEFCDDGEINWKKIVEFNSKKSKK